MYLFQMFEGAALLFSGLSLFKTICNSSDVTLPTARRNTSLALLSSTGLQMLILLGFCGSISLIAPSVSLRTEAILPEAFDYAGVHWIKYISVLAALPILIIILWNILLDITSLLVSMATDGLLWSCVAMVSEKTDTHITGSVLPGILSALCCIVFSQSHLLVVSSLSCLTVMVISIMAALCLRYKPISMLRSPERSAKTHSNRNRKQNRCSPLKNTSPLRSPSGGYGTNTASSSSNGGVVSQSGRSPSGGPLISPVESDAFHGRLIIEDTDESSPVVQNGSSHFTYDMQQVSKQRNTSKPFLAM